MLFDGLRGTRDGVVPFENSPAYRAPTSGYGSGAYPRSPGVVAAGGAAAAWLRPLGCVPLWHQTARLRLRRLFLSPPWRYSGRGSRIATAAARPPPRARAPLWNRTVAQYQYYYSLGSLGYIRTCATVSKDSRIESTLNTVEYRRSRWRCRIQRR
jgi:hypothetical protein